MKPTIQTCKNADTGRIQDKVRNARFQGYFLSPGEDRPAVTTLVGHIFCSAASMGAVEVDSKSSGSGLHDPVLSSVI